MAKSAAAGKHILPYLRRGQKVMDVRSNHIQEILGKVEKSEVGQRTLKYTRGILFQSTKSDAGRRRIDLGKQALQALVL